MFDEEQRPGDGWDASDVAFAGEVKEETAAGEVTLYGDADGNEDIPSAVVVKYQPYGFESRIPAGEEVLLLETNGEDLALVGVNRDQSSLAEGASRQYDSAGNYVSCTMSGVEVYAMIGKTIDLKSSTHLGAATDFMMMGTTCHAALSAFLGSWLTAVTTWESTTTGPEQVYALALKGLLTTLNGTLSTWLSTKHKLD